MDIPAIKYHFNLEGKVSRCTAAFKCPFGASQSYSTTPEGARAKYEALIGGPLAKEPLQKLIVGGYNAPVPETPFGEPKQFFPSEALFDRFAKQVLGERSFGDFHDGNNEDVYLI